LEACSDQRERTIEMTPAAGPPLMLSVTVPVFDERDNLRPLYDQLSAVLRQLQRPWEIIFIDDGSTDGSGAVLDTLAAQDPAVRVIHFRRNFGQTAAMMAGVDFASGEIIVSLDGDLQNDPHDIPRLLAKLDEGYDVCSGWRKARQDAPVRRNLPSRVANRLISAISGVHLHDYGCSLKAYRKNVIKGVRLYGEMHRFIPIFATWQGAKVAEIPVTHHRRIHGESKYGLERVLKVVLDLIVVKFLHRYAMKPMHIFGGFGLLSLLISFAAGSTAIVWRITGKAHLIRTPLPLLSVMSFITGVMCILMGLLAELITRTYYESQGKMVYLVGETRNMQPRSEDTGERQGPPASR
jgi:glycosyltransferase involved in cell wall biosynthesis